MFFRFAAALFLVVLVSMAGVRLEKQTLELRRVVSVQYYQTDLLLELLVRLRLETQQLTAPAQLAETIEKAALAKPPVSAGRKKSKTAAKVEEKEKSATPRLPLMRFQQPFHPEGID